MTFRYFCKLQAYANHWR